MAQEPPVRLHYTPTAIPGERGQRQGGQGQGESGGQGQGRQGEGGQDMEGKDEEDRDRETGTLLETLNFSNHFPAF